MLSDNGLEDIEIANYFRSNLLACRRAIDPVNYRKFAALESNAKRVAFVLNYPEAHELPLEIEGCPEKNLDKALLLKDAGNKFFSVGNFLKSLETYSSAILITPRKDLGIFLANRSAALYNLEFYELALIDADQAVCHGYPQELVYKLEERRAKSYLALKLNEKALEAFRNTLCALDYAKITLEKKKKIETGIRMMLAVMEQGKKSNESSKKLVKTDQILTPQKMMPQKPVIPEIKNINPVYANCSSAINICDAGGIIGRHAIATRDIMPGELLVVEKPHSAVLLQEYQLTNCYYCFRKNIAPYAAACDTCAIVAYCSPKCSQADATVHRNECNIISILWLSHASVTCLLAIKSIIQTPWEKLKLMKKEFQMAKVCYKPSKEDPLLKSSDYRPYWSLVTHESERTEDDLFHRAYMAAWLLRVLKKSPYLPEYAKTLDQAETQLSEDELFIAELILHHLQLLQFNTHEISELIRPRGDSTLAKAKNTFIGGGLFPTAALFNHSCNPGILRYFVGTTMIIRAIRTIRKGQEICDNYGPNFITESESKRQRKLRLQYWFDCACEACTQHWPILENINPKILRFRCETGPDCSNVLLVNTDSNEFMAYCNKCGKSTNIMKGLKALQDTDKLFKLASRSLENGENSEALETYLKILMVLDETLALPIRDYHICQQAIRLTILPEGNSAVV